MFNLCFGHTIPNAHNKYVLFGHEHGISKHAYNISGNNKTCHRIQTDSCVYHTIPRSRRGEQTTHQKCHKIVKKCQNNGIW